MPTEWSTVNIVNIADVNELIGTTEENYHYGFYSDDSQSNMLVLHARSADVEHLMLYRQWSSIHSAKQVVCWLFLYMANSAKLTWGSNKRIKKIFLSSRMTTLFLQLSVRGSWKSKQFSLLTPMITSSRSPWFCKLVL